jgi:hypothetical protein
LGVSLSLLATIYREWLPGFRLRDALDAIDWTLRMGQGLGKPDEDFP